MGSLRWMFRVAALATLACLSGCANLATLQPAETLRKSESRMGLGGTLNAYTLEIDTTTTDPTTGEEVAGETESSSFVIPAAMLWMRYGLTDRLELHGSLWFPIGLSAGFKYMLVGEHGHNGLVISPGIDLAMPVTVTIEDDSITLTDIYVPLHTGYRFNEYFAVYLTPRYVARFVDATPGHAAGGTFGMAIGDHKRLLIEAGAYYDTRTEAPILTGAAGFSFD